MHRKTRAGLWASGRTRPRRFIAPTISCLVLFIAANSYLFFLQSTRAKLARLLEAMYCRICMDRAIDTAFFPCAHVMACSECGARCDRCPLCRAPIQHSQRIFLPMELQDADHLLKQPQNCNKPKDCNEDAFHNSNLTSDNHSQSFHQQRWQRRNGNSQSQEQTSGMDQSSNGSVISQQMAPYAREEVIMDES